MRSTTPIIVSLTVALSAAISGCAQDAGPDDPDSTTPAPAATPAPTSTSPEGSAGPAAPEGTGPAAPEGTGSAAPEGAGPAAPQGVRSPPAGYPAPHPAMPQIPHYGGVVLHDPTIVTVTFAGDPWAKQLQAFGEQVGGLRWWSTVHEGYGVGPGHDGGHVALAETPATSLSDADIEQCLAKRVADGSLPPPTDQSIYTLYYPRSTSVTMSGPEGGISCQVFLGYHSTITVPHNGQLVQIAYAVINRCSDSFDDVTVTASHEFTEAATDPHPIDSNSCGFVILDDNAWTGLGGENGDMCAGVSHATEAGWALTRVWNNVTAAAGDQPCQPAPDTAGMPYYNAGIVHETLGVTPGATASTEVDCYSFGPLPSSMELSAYIGQGSPLQFAFDKKKCDNGDKVTMTVAVASNAPRGYYPYTLMAGLGKDSAHLWRGRVHVQ